MPTYLANLLDRLRCDSARAVTNACHVIYFLFTALHADRLLVRNDLRSYVLAESQGNVRLPLFLQSVQEPNGLVLAWLRLLTSVFRAAAVRVCFRNINSP